MTREEVESDSEHSRENQRQALRQQEEPQFKLLWFSKPEGMRTVNLISELLPDLEVAKSLMEECEDKEPVG